MADLLTKDVQHISVDKLRCHPANPREGDVGAVWESIEQNGFFGALVVQKSSGHVLAGNHRLLAAREAGMDEVPVIYVDVDDEHAMRILLADNRTSDIATYDGEGLADLLEHLASTDDGLAGTGYDGAALDELLRDLQRPGVEDWEGALGALPQEDRDPIGQMTFTLHDEQVDMLKRALDHAKGKASGHPENSNANGNAIAHIAQTYLANAA